MATLFFVAKISESYSPNLNYNFSSEINRKLFAGNSLFLFSFETAAIENFNLKIWNLLSCENGETKLFK